LFAKCSSCIMFYRSVVSPRAHRLKIGHVISNLLFSVYTKYILHRYSSDDHEKVPRGKFSCRLVEPYGLSFILMMIMINTKQINKNHSRTFGSLFDVVRTKHVLAAARMYRQRLTRRSHAVKSLFLERAVNAVALNQIRYCEYLSLRVLSCTHARTMKRHRHCMIYIYTMNTRSVIIITIIIRYFEFRRFRTDVPRNKFDK